MKSIDAGYGNLIIENKIIAIVSFSSAPMKRFLKEMKDKGRVIDISEGRKKHSVLITSDYLFLSAIQKGTLKKKLLKKD